VSVHAWIWAILLGTATVAIAAEAPPATSPLDTIVERVTKSQAAHKNPVVIFDLDETLFRVTDRTRRILQDWSGHLASKYAPVREKIFHLDPERMPEGLSAALDLVEVTDPGLRKSAQRFWGLFYYTNRYLGNDGVIPGAVAYVRAIRDSGARIIYLSGRDEERVKWGTQSALKKWHFPLADESAELHMRPNRKVADLKFKQQEIAKIRPLGEVVAAFTHQAVDANLLKQAFPDAMVVRVDRTGAAAPASNPGILTIANYQAKPKGR
jgi:hypothetical protein